MKNLLQITLAGFIIFFAFRYVIFPENAPKSPLNSFMNKEQAQKAGLYKLNEKEKQELSNWLENTYEPRQSSQSSQGRSLTPHEEYPSISEVTSNGNFLKLDDGTFWQIYPEDTPATQGWLTPAFIKVEYTAEGEYPYTLTNTVTETKVRARKVTHIPENPTESFQGLLDHLLQKGIFLTL